MKYTIFKLFIYTFLAIVFLNCKSTKTIMPDNAITYADFRVSQKTFSTEDGDIKYVDKGAGEVILLLHGVPSSSWLYRKMIDGLVANGYRVIAPDMLGFGSSDSPDGYDIYAPEAHATRLLALMNSLKIEKWNHVMHDAGGLWTWELLKKDPNRIDKMVMLNTIIYEDGFNPPIRMEPGAFASFSMWLYKNGVTTNTMMKQLFKKGLNDKKLPKNEIEGYKTPLVEKKTKGMYHFFSKTCNALPDYKEVLATASMPVAVVWGENDEMLQWQPQKDAVMNDLKIEASNENYH